MCWERAAQTQSGSDCPRLSHWRAEFDAALTLRQIWNAESRAGSSGLLKTARMKGEDPRLHRRTSGNDPRP